MTGIVSDVAILDNNTLEPIFVSSSPMKASIKREKRATKFAVEDGTDRSDHVVSELATAEIEFVTVDDVRNAYDSLRQAWERNELVTVQTKFTTVPSMLILNLPHSETVEGGDSIKIVMRLQEWVEVRPEEGALPPRKVAQKKQSSTVNRGQVQSQTVQKKSAVAEMLDSLRGAS